MATLTNPYMTIFERSQAIHMRVLQLTIGNQRPLVNLKTFGSYDPLKIATYEIDNKLVKYIINREVGDKEENIRLQDISILPM